MVWNANYNIIFIELSIKYYILNAAAILSEYKTQTGMSFSTCKTTPSIELYWETKTMTDFSWLSMIASATTDSFPLESIFVKDIFENSAVYQK